MIWFNFDSIRNRSAGCYSGHVIIEEQTNGWTDSQLMSSSLNDDRKQHKFTSDYRHSADEDDESLNNIMSSTKDKERVPTTHFGRFCGQMSVRMENFKHCSHFKVNYPIFWRQVRSATYFSEHNNVSLILYVPSRASVVVHSFSLYLTYKFLPARPAHTRYGPPGKHILKFLNIKNIDEWCEVDKHCHILSDEPYELGVKVEDTHCDRLFNDCYGGKRCKVRSPNWPGFYNRNITCKSLVRQTTAVPKGYRARIVVSQVSGLASIALIVRLVVD